MSLLLILNKSSLAIWIGSVLFGLSVGSIYPSAIAFTEKQISLTGKRMSILSVGGSAGDAVIPLLIGYMINPKLLGPIGFIIILLIVIISASLIYGSTLLYVNFQLKKMKNTKK
ncbi:unnamed protein product [Rotaria magnacalcarata]|nr:unnamed protein product [Rotaria magnacalcarata]